MSSRKEEERNEKIVRGLMKLPPNRRCINCNSLGPQYVCTNFWTFVCMTCSGIHREFTHRVKSVSMSKFTSQEVEALQEGGNQRARETFLRDWDPREQRLPDNSNVDKVRYFIKNVYVDKKFFASKASGKPPRDTLNHRNLEDETRRASSYHSYSQSPPYDYQYEERRYGKQAPVLTKKPGSDRGMLRILSTSRLSDHVQEDRFANEVVSARVSDYSVTNGGDLFRPDTQSPPSLSHSSGSGKFDGLDLFSAPNLPQSATSASFAEPGKFDGLDLFSAPNPPQSTISTPSTEHGRFNGLDLFSAQDPPQSATSAPSTELGRFDGLDLFNAPDPPQSATSVPSTEPGKFDGLDFFSVPKPLQSAAFAPPSTEPKKSYGLDLFELLATSSASVAPTLSVDQEFKAFEPTLDQFTITPLQQSTETLNDKSTDTQKNEGWATFDTPVSVKNYNQSWSSFEESTTPFDPFLAWGLAENFKMKETDLDTRSSAFDSTTPHEIRSLDSSHQLPVLDGTRSHGLDIKSCNPFDLPSETDESSNMLFDMRFMQSALPNHNMSPPWVPESAATPFTPDTLVFMSGHAPSLQFPSIQAQGPVAAVGGNPFG